MKAWEIIKIMQELAPTALALEHDNVGLILGDAEKEVKRVLVALDLNDEVADEAVEIKADFVITHHPLIFSPLKKITSDNSIGRRIIKLIKNDIAVYAAHTNLDIARSGTCDTLFDLLELSDSGEPGLIAAKSSIEDMWLGRIGMIENGIRLSEFCSFIKERLGLKVISYAGDSDMLVKKIGICTGSASDMEFLEAAAARHCDAYITGDVTYHKAQAALELGLAIIDGTHFGTELIIVPRLAALLSERLDGAEVFKSRVCCSILKII